jgi:hypothetical protein
MNRASMLHGAGRGVAAMGLVAVAVAGLILGTVSRAAADRRIRAARDRSPEIDDTTVRATVLLPVDLWRTPDPTVIKRI